MNIDYIACKTRRAKTQIYLLKKILELSAIAMRVRLFLCFLNGASLAGYNEARRVLGDIKTTPCAAGRVGN